MWNDFKCGKKVAYAFVVCFVITILIFLFFDSNPKGDFAIAKSSEDELEEEFSKNVDSILSDIDSNELDDYLTNEFGLDFFDAKTFKDLVVKILNGEYFSEYDSLLDLLINLVKSGLKDLIRMFFIFIVIIILFELFKNLYADKFVDIKKIVKIVFMSIAIILLLQIFKTLSNELKDVVQKIFSFSKALFPILLSLILMSGSVGSHSVYNSLFIFLINTGSYVFTYFLMPLATAIFVLTLANSLSSDKRLSKVIDLFKAIFKYVVIIFFSIFGLFSSINLITSGVKDGVSLRLTKYAIKNYIPIIGGYVSQGFDFIHSCSIVIKNAFGVCGILILILIVIKPVIIYVVYQFFFKILSTISGLVGNGFYSDLFSNISKALTYFLIVLVGLFFLMFVFLYLLIISISVV